MISSFLKDVSIDKLFNVTDLVKIFHQSHHVTAVGWNRHNPSETATDTILLGTSKGLFNYVHKKC
jgi:hypothetical protein